MDRREALRLVPVSRETEERLALYADLLGRWQTVKNLVGPSTMQHLWTRHIADSAQLLGLAPTARHWVDFGSGAGFPGLVTAIQLAETSGAHVDLIESNNRKCAFLREVVRATQAPARVHAGRIEDILPTLSGAVEVVTSRAMASVDDLISLGRPLLEAGALGLFLTGRDPPRPSAAPGRTGWRIDTSVSKTHDAGRIVMVRRSASCENGT